MVVSSLIVVGLASFSSTDIRDVASFKNTRSVLYAAESAVQVAISNTRYTYPTSTSPGLCPANSSQVSTGVTSTGALVPYTLDGVNIDVGCVYNTVIEGQSPNSRVYTLSAYPASDYCGAALCHATARALVQTQVWFNDWVSTASGSSNNCSTAGATCGTSMIIYNWVVQPGLT